MRTFSLSVRELSTRILRCARVSCAFTYLEQYIASLYSVGVLQRTLNSLLIKVKVNRRSPNWIAIIDHLFASRRWERGRLP